jgi:hypothetical protein
MALQSFCWTSAPLSVSEILYTVGRNSLTGSARHKATTYTQNNTDIEWTHTYIHALSGIRTHDPSVRVSEDSSCLRPCSHWDQHITYTNRPECTNAICFLILVIHIFLFWVCFHVHLFIFLCPCALPYLLDYSMPYLIILLHFIALWFYYIPSFIMPVDWVFINRFHTQLSYYLNGMNVHF